MAGAVKTRPNTPNPMERLSEYGQDLAGEAVKTLKSDVKDNSKTFIEQLLGMSFDGKDAKATHAEQPKAEPQKNSTGIEIFDIIAFPKSTEHKRSSEKAPRIEAAINYSADIARSGERASRNEMHQMSQNIQEIKAELSKLMLSSKKLSMDFALISTEQAPVEVGTYHQNFFEWMLIVIKQARQKVEDSDNWLNTVKGKGKGKSGKKASLDLTKGLAHQAGERTTIQNSAG